MMLNPELLCEALPLMVSQHLFPFKETLLL